MGCTHDCSSCGESCESKEKENLIKAPNPASTVRRVIAVMSGKGGVGKSLVTALMSVLMQRRGHQTAVMDADVTGPSVPRMFGIKGRADGTEAGIQPIDTKTGIETVSINYFLEDTSEPVVWRGPILGGVVTQFWTDVVWTDVDYMFVDMPPGTGDIPLTVLQSLPVDGIIMVTSPQELVADVVEKAVKMAKMMNIPILGLVENMSYVECPGCREKIYLYGKGKTEETAARYALPVLAQIPITPDLASLCDRGLVELFEGSWLDDACTMIETVLSK
ncbi:MAG: Mrp/NBP35 family ATP-binding protein [Firmicutes bacterium]|nr:Mrp/NBP35 family ATP-binding protein [Bacillota bacterium]